MNALDSAYFSPRISDPDKIKKIHELASSWNGSSPSGLGLNCPISSQVSRSDILGWLATGSFPNACFIPDNIRCAGPVTAYVAQINKSGWMTVSPERYAGFTGTPIEGFMPGDPLSNPAAAVFYWRYLAMTGLWLATYEGMFPCPASCYYPGCAVPFSGFIKASDILSAMAPDWSGLYRPLATEPSAVPSSSVPNQATQTSQQPTQLTGTEVAQSTAVAISPSISVPVIVIIAIILLAR